MTAYTPEEDPRRAHMTEEELFIDDYAVRVDQIAAREHKSSTIFTVEDVKQEIWAAALKELHNLLQRGEGFVINFMNRAAGRFVHRARIEEMYATGKFIYTPEIVRTVLELGAWDSTPEGDWDMRLDVRSAYDRLGERDQHLVAEAYRWNEELSETEKRAVRRAVDKMTHLLNVGSHTKVVTLDDVIRMEG